MKNENSILHIHAQYDSHSDAYICGKREALIRLRDSLSILLAGQGSKDESGAEAVAFGVWANDGEGYNVYLVMDETRWEKAQPAYTAEYMQMSDSQAAETLHPSSRFSNEIYMKEHNRGFE